MKRWPKYAVRILLIVFSAMWLRLLLILFVNVEYPKSNRTSFRTISSRMSRPFLERNVSRVDYSVPNENQTHRIVEGTRQLSHPSVEGTDRMKVLQGTGVMVPSSLDEIEGHIPSWLYEYLKWHQRQRRKDPQLQHTKLLIKYCTRNCGGIHDRLSDLWQLLWVAYSAKRLLLFLWYSPHPLETFLVPNLINWTVPDRPEWQSRQGFLDTTTDFVQWERDMIDQRSHNKSLVTHATIVDSPLDDVPVLRLMFWGQHRREDLKFTAISSSRDNNKGESNGELEREESLTIATTTANGITASPFGHAWHALFRPAPATQGMLDDTIQALQLGYITTLAAATTAEAATTINKSPMHLQDYYYVAAHCRVRHPGRFPPDANAEGKKPGTSADVSGLPWNGRYREMAVTVALRAMHCAEWVVQKHHRQRKLQHARKEWQRGDHNSSLTDQPIVLYFLSDSDDLVASVVDTLPKGKAGTGLNTPTYNRTAERSNSLERRIRSTKSKSMQGQGGTEANYIRLLGLVQNWKERSRYRVVSRNVWETPATHLDREKKVPKRTHIASFVDLYLAIQARCLVFGVGNFAYFAARISGTDCIARYENITHHRFNQQTGGAPYCPEFKY